MFSLSNLLGGHANFDSYGISPVGLTFRHPDEESKYRARVLGNSIGHIRFSVVFGLLLVIAYGPLDALMYADGLSIQYVHIVRYAIITPVVIIVLLNTFYAWYIENSQKVGLVCLSLIGISWALFYYKEDTVIVMYIFPAIVMTMIYVFFFVGLFFINSLFLCVIIVVVHSIMICFANVPVPVILNLVPSLVVIFFLLAMATYQKELLSRQLFISEIRERETLERQVHADSRYLNWLRQLAKFLRHEVRQPVAQINSSIELIGVTYTDDDRLRPYLANAALGAQHVWNLVERASRATDAEAFVRQSQAHLIDLNQLIAELVESHKRTVSGVDFRLQCEEQMYVTADPILVKEAVGNLLANAASFAYEHSNVEVLMSVEGSCAAIRVRNKGPIIEEDTEGLFGPFASTRSGPSSEHQGLGLYLVRLIAEHYGGTADILNFADGSGVEASMSLRLTG